MKNELFHLLASPFISAYDRVASYIPNIAAALLLLLIGMSAARAIKTVVDKLLHRAKLDEYTSKVGINEVLSRLGLGKSPASGISFLIYWFILFVFFVSAAEAVNMPAVSDLLERFLVFLPRLISSILILFAGLMFARFCAEVIERAAEANNVRGGKVLSQAIYATVVVLFSITAMEQLGMQMTFISSALQIVLASGGLAIALAFGLGGKEAAAEVIRGIVKKEEK